MDSILAQRLVTLLRKGFDQQTLRSISSLVGLEKKNLKTQTQSGRMFYSYYIRPILTTGRFSVVNL